MEKKKAVLLTEFKISHTMCAYSFHTYLGHFIHYGRDFHGAQGRVRGVEIVQPQATPVGQLVGYHAVTHSVPGKRVVRHFLAQKLEGGARIEPRPAFVGL